MATIALSGFASGIGAAIQNRLERAGAVVIGVDLRGSIEADLADPDGRARAIERVVATARGPLDGVVACAGVGPQADPATIVALDFLGGGGFLAGLRSALAGAPPPAAVAISSNSAAVSEPDPALAAACLADDEPQARRLAAVLPGHVCYATAKRALATWVRRVAPAPEWAGAGIRLNAVAPGPIRTPLLQGGLDHPLYGVAIRSFPVPTGAFGTPDDVAALVEFLLGPGARFMCGSIVFCDGGTDALLRPDAL